MNTRLLLTLPLLALAFSVGCAATTEGDEQGASEDELRTKIEEGSFRLYRTPRAVPSPGCDVHTKLDLEQGTFATARLENGVDGLCELFVPPNPRSFRLRQTGTVCGSKVFEGSRVKNGERSTIKIVDHRSRVCRDMPEAQIVVEETVGQGPVSVLYSLSPNARPQTEEVTGKFQRVMAIGAETTGLALVDKQGVQHEIRLPEHLLGQFQDGETARATGARVTVRGLERGPRSVFNVSELLVCPAPGYVNCMPRVGPMGGGINPLCGEQSWIKENCPGVDFAH